MRKLLLVSTLLVALCPAALLGQGVAAPRWEVRVSAGVFNVGAEGADGLIQVRPPGSPWLMGLRFVQWMDTFHDPFTGRALTDTRERRYGVTLDYAFRPERTFTWVLGAAVLRCTKAETSRITGETGRDATTGVFVGGGLMGRLGPMFTYHLGIYLAPGADLHTQTSVSSEDDSGSFDIRAGFGLRF